MDLSPAWKLLAMSASLILFGLLVVGPAKAGTATSSPHQELAT